MLADLPRWTEVSLIRTEIKRRFGHGDKDDLDIRLNRCQEFEREWDKTRIDYTKRLNALRSQFDRKLEQAVGVISGIQTMNDEMKAFERDENQVRPQLPGVFSVGAFKSEDACLTLKVDLRAFFADLIDTMRNWAEKTRT